MKKHTILFSIVAMMLVMVACSQGEKTQVACSVGQEVQESQYVILDDYFSKDEYGIAMRRGDYALNREIQKHLDDMIADGTFSGISNKWFGEYVSLPESDFVEDYEATEDDTSLQDILDKGYLIMGLQSLFPPMTYEDESKEMVGFDIDLAKEVATRMGVELKFQPIAWDEKEIELNKGNIDVIWSGMAITKPRMERMYFSKPYMASKEVIVVPAGSDIVDRTKLKGKTVGVLRASSGLEAIQADEETFASIGELKQYSNLVVPFNDLKDGKIDAVVGDEITLSRLIDANTIKW